jgi:NitT/TauT family transport system ATP-binding protein
MNMHPNFANEDSGAAQNAPTRAMVSFDGVSKSFAHDGRALPVVSRLSLDISPGELTAFLGPSGCGKTTLLNMAAGLLRADGGQVFYKGRALAGANTDVGYLTQVDALLPWRTVLGNVTLPLEIRRVGRAERRERARVVLERVGLADFTRHFPRQLSGGMRKRVALARTLVYAPETLLLDEPFSALDAQTRVIMQRHVRDLARELGLTVVLVTHDIDEAISIADRIVVFSNRPARVVADVRVSQDDSATLRRATGHPLYERLMDLLSAEEIRR